MHDAMLAGERGISAPADERISQEATVMRSRPGKRENPRSAVMSGMPRDTT